jgi:hypothetical protein
MYTRTMFPSYPISEFRQVSVLGSLTTLLVVPLLPYVLCLSSPTLSLSPPLPSSLPPTAPILTLAGAGEAQAWA